MKTIYIAIKMLSDLRCFPFTFQYTFSLKYFENLSETFRWVENMEVDWELIGIVINVK